MIVFLLSNYGCQLKPMRGWKIFLPS